jgi:carboxylesterase type B
MWEEILTSIFPLDAFNVRITVMGQSAGAGSIMHHLTAPKSVAPTFQRAIIQSPAFFPQYHTSVLTKGRYDDKQLVAQFNNFSTAANCTGTPAAQLICLQGLDSNSLQDANVQTIQQAPDGQFVYGPAIDPSYVTDLPGILLENGQFTPDVKLLIGHTQYVKSRFN